MLCDTLMQKGEPAKVHLPSLYNNQGCQPSPSYYKYSYVHYVYYHRVMQVQVQVLLRNHSSIKISVWGRIISIQYKMRSNCRRILYPLPKPTNVNRFHFIFCLQFKNILTSNDLSNYLSLRILDSFFSVSIRTCSQLTSFLILG